MSAEPHRHRSEPGFQETREPPLLLRYGGAVLAVLIATLVRWPVLPLIGEEASPFFLFYPAVMLSGWYGGLGPGLLATALSALSAQYFFSASPLALMPASSQEAVRAATFALTGAFISALNEALHRARRRALADARTLRRSEEERARLLAGMEQALRQAEQANRSKDEFLATVSHELRTPLNSVMGWAQLLLMSCDDPQRTGRGLQAILRNARQQAQLIEDLLDVSRIVSGKMRLEVRPVELEQVIEAALEAARPAAEAKQIRLHSILDPRAGPVAGDPDRLQQVVWNLLSNAIKFTPRQGSVEVRLERVGSHVEVLVADTGLGIRPDFLPHVFERFRQLDSSTTRIHGGLGLGLAIVRHLVELHGGTVEASSEGEGQGAIFIVRLPLAPVLPEAAPGDRIRSRAEDGTAPPPSAADLGDLRVLVVDDEAEARESLTEILQSCGAQVQTAASADEALAVLERFRPHVLLSDIGMPGRDGYSLIREVRALPPERGGTVPAAALTAFARGEDRRRALLAGFQNHLAKPVEIAELTTVVAGLARGAGSGPPRSGGLS